MNPSLLSLLHRSLPDIGHGLVSPRFHADSRFMSEDSRDSAHLFASKFLTHQHHDELDPLEYDQGGATDKAHFRVGGQRDEDDKMLPSSVFMVKPYYEDTQHVQWSPYPLAGWAEMAWHGILHASELGHTAMRVHSFPYGNSALLGVDLEPGVIPVDWTKPEHRINGVEGDAYRIAALDFLLNHQDRHSGNLMVRLGDTKQANGVLAIDNGRSMQYLEANRFNAKNWNADNLFHYLNSNAYSHFHHGNNMSQPLRAISSWWKDNRGNIKREFARHLDGIQHPELALHMHDSFKDRCNALDDVMKDYKKHGSIPYDQHLNGETNGLNKKLMARATVEIRDFNPEENIPIRDPRYHSESESAPCPSCGESY